MLYCVLSILLYRFDLSQKCSSCFITEVIRVFSVIEFKQTLNTLNNATVTKLAQQKKKRDAILL